MTNGSSGPTITKSISFIFICFKRILKSSTFISTFFAIEEVPAFPGKHTIYKHNNFEIVEEGDYVLCAISGKKIMLKNLQYWNVDNQEAYYSAAEANEKLKNSKND